MGVDGSRRCAGGSARSDSNYDVVPCKQETYDAGFKLFSSHRDKHWSLADCISFGVMREKALVDALTADHHYTQAGFNAVFRSD